MYFIYKILNNKNNKVYIGLTNNCAHRFNQHASAARTEKYNYPLYNAMRKYGIENFWYVQIDQSSNIDEIRKKEIDWIKYYNSQDDEFGYNLRGGGEIPYHSDSSIEKFQNTCYSMGLKHRKNRLTKYKNITKAHESFRAILSVYGERKELGLFRTEEEAAWEVDVNTRKFLSDVNNPYLNFPNGKTEELIKEQLATRKMLEIVKYLYFDVAFGGAYKNKYYVRVRTIDGAKDKVIFHSYVKSECEDALKKFIYENKAIKKYRNSLSVMQLEFEKLHGSIHNLYTKEELNEEIKNKLGKFD